MEGTTGGVGFSMETLEEQIYIILIIIIITLSIVIIFYFFFVWGLSHENVIHICVDFVFKFLYCS